MAILRGGAIGFLQFFAAFTFKNDLFALGTVATPAGIGLFGGNLIAPRLRNHLREEMILAGSLLVSAVTTLFGVVLPATLGIPLSFLAVGLGEAAGRSGSTASSSARAGRGARPRVRSLRDAVPGRMGARRLLGIIPVASAAGLGVLGLVLAFGGLSYLAALAGGAAAARPSRTKLRPEAVDRALDRARTPTSRSGGGSAPAAAGGRAPTAAAAPTASRPRRPHRGRAAPRRRDQSGPVTPPPRRRRSGTGGR